MSQTRLLKVALRSEHDLVLARQRVRQIAELLDLGGRSRTRLATAVSEVARNAIQYGGGGSAEISIEHSDPSVLWATIHDDGPGIENLDEVLSGNYRSTTGMGLGLIGARRLVDHFSVDTHTVASASTETRAASSSAPPPPRGTHVQIGQDLDSTVDRSAIIELIDELAHTPPGDPFAEILQQNQELLGAQTDLAEAYRRLEQMDHAKNNFLAMLGHELRNMLNALRSSLEVLSRGPELTIRNRMESLAIGQVEHLRRLVEDLLDASHITRGTLEIQDIPLDLSHELSTLLTSWREEVRKAGLRLVMRLPPTPVWVKADPTRLAQIIGNLLSNACKFTDPGGEVRVELDAGDDERVHLNVSDTGCGISPELLPSIFEPFSQTAEARSRMTGGLGLGLAIVSALVAAHDGELVAESAGKDTGTTFRITLPTTPSPVAPGAPHPHQAGSAMRILLIDDHEASVMGLAELLRMDGHEVEIAYDGPSALEKVKSFDPEFVLCDIGLPGMDGYEVARVLRTSDQDLRLVALSGFADPASKQQAMEAGFDDHLSKPVNITALMARLGDNQS